MDVSKLNNPYQQSILIEAQATYYPDMVSVYIPKNRILRKPETDSNMLGGSIIKEEDDSDATSDESNIERSIRRTKKRISDYVLCNPFDMFATFTFANDRQNQDRIRQQMKDWLKNQRNRNGRFQYLFVPEYHKDGESLHFHALLLNYSGTVEKAINPKTDQPLVQKGKQVYTLSGYRLGFSNVKLLGETAEDRSKVAAYIKKYITKDIPIIYAKQRYWASKGLVLPQIEDNPQHWYKHVKPDWEIETPNGKIMRFNYKTHELTDIYIDAYGRDQ